MALQSVVVYAATPGAGESSWGYARVSGLLENATVTNSYRVGTAPWRGVNKEQMLMDG